MKVTLFCFTQQVPFISLFTSSEPLQVGQLPLFLLSAEVMLIKLSLYSKQSFHASNKEQNKTFERVILNIPYSFYYQFTPWFDSLCLEKT